jgi:hypothetical protein
MEGADVENVSEIGYIFFLSEFTLFSFISRIIRAFLVEEQKIVKKLQKAQRPELLKKERLNEKLKLIKLKREKEKHNQKLQEEKEAKEGNRVTNKPITGKDKKGAPASNTAGNAKQADVIRSGNKQQNRSKYITRDDRKQKKN